MDHLALCKDILGSIATWLLILPSLPFFLIYRIIVDIVLRIKHGKSYGGLFDMRDCFFFLPDAGKFCMVTVFYVKSDWETNLYEVMRKVIKDKVFSKPGAYPKLTSSKHDFGGYPYWLKNDVTLDDTVKFLEIPQDKTFTEEYLKELTGEISGRDYPKNETVLWEVFISEKSIDNKNANICTTSFQYPVIVRFHHSICDGTSLVSLLIRLFGDESSQNYEEELIKMLFKENLCDNSNRSTREVIRMNAVKFIKTIRLWLDVIFVEVWRIIEETHLRTPDQNALHKPVYSKERIVAWAVEEYVECIPLIKKIRCKTNSKFMSVVCTAISASMTSYFKRNSYPIPDYTSGGLAQITNFPPIEPSKPVRLENKSSAYMVKLPTNKQPNTLIETLKKTDEVIKQESNYSNSLVTSFFVSVLYGIIPIKILSCVDGLVNHTFIISNIPGGSQINIYDGCAFEKVIGMAPNVRGVGVSVTLLSYDNRLQIGIVVDRILTKSQKEVQRIADDILYYIKIMATEVRKIYGE